MTVQLAARDSFATDVVRMRFLRFACPHCAKVLKIRAEAAGSPSGGEGPVRGRCPQCGIEVEFCRDVATEKSRTARALEGLLSEKEWGMREGQFQRLALLLSQGTCRDYALGRELLGGRGLSAREWRRALKEAAVREIMRRRLEVSVLGDAPSEVFSFCEDAEDEAQGAWEIMVRFIHHGRHGDCEACRENPTGLACVYLHF